MGMGGKHPRRLSPLVGGGGGIGGGIGTGLEPGNAPGSSSHAHAHALQAELAALRRAQAAQGDALRSMMAGYARLGDRIEDLCARLDHHTPPPPPPPPAAEPLPTAEEEAADADAAAAAAADAAAAAGATTTAASDDDASLLPRSELDSCGLVRARSKQGSSGNFLDVVHQMTASVRNKGSSASVVSVDEPQ